MAGMRAVVVEGPGQPTVTEVPEPAPGPNDVVVADRKSTL